MPAVTALSFIEIVWGEPESAIEHLLEALRLSPRDPQRPVVFLNLAMASGCAGRYADGVDYARLGIREAPGFAPLHAHLAVNYVGLGELAKARAALENRRALPRGRSNGRWRDSCSKTRAPAARHDVPAHRCRVGRPGGRGRPARTARPITGGAPGVKGRPGGSVVWGVGRRAFLVTVRGRYRQER